MKFTIAALLVLAVSQFCASAQVLPYGNPDEAGSGSWSSAYREAYALFRKGMYDRSMILFKDLAGDSADGNAYGYYVLSAVRLRAPGYENLQDEFLEFAKEQGMAGIKGHRSVGGFRASIYNACPLESVQALVKCMQEFESMKK